MPFLCLFSFIHFVFSVFYVYLSSCVICIAQIQGHEDIIKSFFLKSKEN
jgi:hypothetical protein